MKKIENYRALSSKEQKEIKGGRNAPANGCFCSAIPITIPKGMTRCMDYQNLSFCPSNQVYVCCFADSEY